MILLKQFMAWVIASNRTHNPIFPGLRWRLLLSYLTVMAAILGMFATGVYVFFTRSLYRQLDEELLTLAQAAAPSLEKVKNEGGEHLEQVDEVPWRDLFNRDQQSLEWFNADRKLLARKGDLSVAFPPETGSYTVKQERNPEQIRTFTISVYISIPNRDLNSTIDSTLDIRPRFRDGHVLDSNENRYNDELNPNKPFLKGYIRASQSTEKVETVRSKLFWGLVIEGTIALGLVGIGGMWLTRKAVEPIEQSFKQLKHFTADASHELRSPLTAIKISVDVMLNHPERIHPKDAKKLAAIASATAQMTYLTEDLLLLARTDAAELRQAREWIPISLNKVLEDLVQLLEPSAIAKGITLKSHWLADVSVVGDAAQITRLFSNLLENALQYTPTGGTVVLFLARHNRSCIVSVKDTGVGIASEQQRFVFDRFWRTDKARSHREGGMGLGLAIAKAIAQSHGGEITLSSQVGVGSCFRVHLPVA